MQKRRYEITFELDAQFDNEATSTKRFDDETVRRLARAMFKVVNPHREDDGLTSVKVLHVHASGVNTQ